MLKYAQQLFRLMSSMQRNGKNFHLLWPENVRTETLDEVRGDYRALYHKLYVDWLCLNFHWLYPKIELLQATSYDVQLGRIIYTPLSASNQSNHGSQEKSQPAEVAKAMQHADKYERSLYLMGFKNNGQCLDNNFLSENCEHIINGLSKREYLSICSILVTNAGYGYDHLVITPS
jgi:hypothetical protein